MIAAYMLTCAERAAMREESVRSLDDSDWGAPIEVYVNPVKEGRPEQRIAVGMLELLRRALAGAGEYFLICEDDVLFHPELRARLEGWAPFQAGVIGMASLYYFGVSGTAWTDFPANIQSSTFNIQHPIKDACGAELRTSNVELPTSNDETCFRSTINAQRSTLVVDAEQAIGSQARLFSRACAEYVVREYRPSAWAQDIAVARLAARCAPILYHVPSLMQHVGRESTWGGPFHEALDFAVAA